MKFKRRFYIFLAWTVYEWQRLKPKLKKFWIMIVVGIVVVVLTLIEGLFVPYIYHELKIIKSCSCGDGLTATTRQLPRENQGREILQPNKDTKQGSEIPGAAQNQGEATYHNFLINILQTNQYPECSILFSDCVQLKR